MNLSGDFAVYFGLTVVVFGFAAVMTGSALASNWRPWRQLLGYTSLLGATNRFLVYALFAGELLSFSGYVRDTVTLLLIATVAYRTTQAKRMVTQYPWRYRRQGWLFWHSIEQADEASRLKGVVYDRGKH